VERSVGTILANVRAVGVDRQRYHGRTGGKHEDERQCCDEGLHGWSPLVAENGFRTTSP
jgi:hypothetical protein